MVLSTHESRCGRVKFSRIPCDKAGRTQCSTDCEWTQGQPSSVPRVVRVPIPRRLRRTYGTQEHPGVPLCAYEYPSAGRSRPDAPAAVGAAVDGVSVIGTRVVGAVVVGVTDVGTAVVGTRVVGAVVVGVTVVGARVVGAAVVPTHTQNGPCGARSRCSQGTRYSRSTHATVGTSTALHQVLRPRRPLRCAGGGGSNGAPVTLHTGCAPAAAAPGALGLK